MANKRQDTVINPEHILPYDYQAYFDSPERYVMVTTNCLTGKKDCRFYFAGGE